MLDGLTPKLPLREWAFVHSELLWVYNHKVLDRNANRFVKRDPGEHRVWLIREGEVTVTTPSEGKLRAGAGNWVFCPSGDFHQYFSPDSRVFSLHFNCRWPSGESLFAGYEGWTFSLEGEPELSERAEELERSVSSYLGEVDSLYFGRHADYEHFLIFHTLFLQWLFHWYRIQRARGIGMSRLSPDDDRTLRALRCLNTAPLAKGYPRKELLRVSSLSEAHLNRLFHAEHGMTLRKCWEQRQLAHAKTCLETSQMLVKEIAFSLGFRSDSHFMLWFKQRTGKRPVEYRKTHRDPNILP